MTIRGFSLLILVSLTLPSLASAETMEGVFTEASNGNQFGSLVLERNSTQDDFKFQFRTKDLHIEGAHWSNMMTFPDSKHPGFWSTISCPRVTPCVIFIGKTHVRVEYDVRDGVRFATNIVGLDPQIPNQ
jgi:hypothetical protein